MNYEELIIKAIITLIFAIIAGYIIPLIKSNVEADKWSKMCDFAEIAVRAAEQILKDNPTKREYVIKYLTEKAQEIGLKLNEQDISNLCEYAVNLVKHNKEYAND